MSQVVPPGALTAAGLGWQASGHATLAGPLYRLADACDQAFLALASLWAAEPEEHPAMIAAATLQRVGYLTSFPHQATFPVCLDADSGNLHAFTGSDPVNGDGVVRLARTAPARDLLTPAACYHIYPHHEGEQLGSLRYITTRNTCFRRETYYEPLRRQWSFRMREIVCLGTRGEVQGFLEHAKAVVSLLLRELDLPVRWEDATDPFFEPSGNPLYLAQVLQPTKQEARFGGDLAIASLNLHEDHFGAAFGIRRAGQPATSGCMAFGIERWLYAIASRHGCDPAAWPDPVAAVRRATGPLATADTRMLTEVGQA